MDEKDTNHDETRLSWFERPSNINLLIGLLIVACVGLVIAEFAYSKKDAHFEIEKFFGFQAWFGFAAFVTVVFIGKFLRLFLKRDEDYYDA